MAEGGGAMTQSELDNIVSLHGMWLRDEPGGARADLQRIDLCGANLCSADLRGVDLIGANLSDAKLRGAKLRGTNLYGAKLRDADLYGAELCEANMSEADLSGAKLIGADLRDVDLIGAKLRDADLYRAELPGANMSDAEMSGVDLCGAKLIGANMSGADLTWANLCSANLRGANIKDAQFDVEIEDGLLQRIAKLVLSDNAKLAMQSVHTCNTTHCIAGWACHLAEQGKEMEEQYGWSWAGLRLLGPEAATHFYDSDQNAIAWLRGVVR